MAGKIYSQLTYKALHQEGFFCIIIVIMPDKIQICQNCKNPFVYSEYEQVQNAKQNKPEPLYCPICSSLKSQEQKRPKKPSTPTMV